MVNRKRIQKELKGLIRYKKEGIALVTSLALISTMSILGLTLMTTTLVEIRSADRFENRLTAFHWAEGAVDQTIVALRANSNYTGVPSTATTNGRVTGSYQTTVTATGTANVYQIAAAGSAGTTASQPGVQTRNITVVFENSPPSPFGNGIFANSTISMSGDFLVDAYDTRTNPTYDANFALQEGHIATNGTSSGIVALSGDVLVKGNVTVGPGANVSQAINQSSDVVVTGTKSAAQSVTTMNPVTIPSGLTDLGDLSISSSPVTKAGGTYLYKNISISGDGSLSFTGATTIYVTGQLSISGDAFGTASNLPPNLKILVSGNNGVSISGDGNLYAAIYAPQSPVSISGDAQLYGSIVGNTFTYSGDGQIHYDKALSQVSVGSSSNKSARSWNEL